MIQIIAMNDINIHEYATDYSLDITRVDSDNVFKASNGKEIRKLMGHKTVISCTLQKVPDAIAKQIATITGQNKFNLTYTTPLEITKKFCCSKYNATIKNSDPRQKNPLITDNITWNISLTLESTEIAADSGDGL